MSDPLGPVGPGDPIPTAAATWNPILETARRGRAGKLSAPRGRPQSSTLNPVVEVLVKNNTGSNLGARAVVKLGRSIVSAADQPFAVQNRPAVAGTAPDADDNVIGILLEPIPAGRIGRAAVSGAVVCELSVGSTSHTHAAPAAGNTSRLVTGTSGPAIILGTLPGTGSQRALCLLEQPGECCGWGADWWSDFYPWPFTTVHGGDRVYYPLTSGQSYVLKETYTEVPGGFGDFVFDARVEGVFHITPLGGSGQPSGACSFELWAQLVEVRPTTAQWYRPASLPTLLGTGGYDGADYSGPRVSYWNGWFFNTTLNRNGRVRTHEVGELDPDGNVYFAWSIFAYWNGSGSDVAVWRTWGAGHGNTHIYVKHNCCAEIDPPQPPTSPPPPSPPAGSPVAAFSGTPLTGDAPLAVAFTDASTNTPTGWFWVFGDGGTDTVQNPSHTYTADGIYTVSLTATNGSGSDTETKIDYVIVGDYTPPPSSPPPPPPPPAPPPVTYGPFTPGTIANAGIGVNWTIPGANAELSSIELTTGQASRTVRFSNWNMGVASGSTPVGLKFTLTRAKIGAGTIEDVIIQVSIGGALVGDNKALTTTAWPAAQTSQDYGSQTDTWTITGLDWNDLNDPTFAVDVVIHEDGVGNAYAGITGATLTAYATPP